MLNEEFFLTAFIEEIIRDGWGDISLGYNFQNIYFEIYARKKIRYLTTKIRFHLFVIKSSEHVSLNVFQSYIGLYPEIYEGLGINPLSSIFLPTGFETIDDFILCVISSKGISEAVIPQIDQFDKFNILKGKRGFLCLVDLEKKTSHMKIPSFGYSLKESLETLLKNTEAAFLTIDNRIVTEDVRKLSIERNILDYLRAHDNRIKISEASLDLHIANKEIEDAIISLETKGFLRRSVEEH
jgi:hypothetical protein